MYRPGMFVKMHDEITSFDDMLAGKEAVIICPSRSIRRGWWVVQTEGESKALPRLVIEDDIKEVLHGQTC